jgi:hypothetical protein
VHADRNVQLKPGTREIWIEKEARNDRERYCDEKVKKMYEGTT